MCTLATFSTPHIGITNSGSKLVKASLKVWTRITKHMALKQMHLADALDIKDTYLMALSNYEVLCGSCRDLAGSKISCSSLHTKTIMCLMSQQESSMDPGLLKSKATGKDLKRWSIISSRV